MYILLVIAIIMMWFVIRFRINMMRCIVDTLQYMKNLKRSINNSY